MPPLTGVVTLAVRAADAVGHQGGHVRGGDEIVHRLVEVPDAEQAAAREVVFPGQVELRGAERIELGIARIAAVEFEADRGTAGALAGSGAGEAVLQAAAQLLQVLRRHHPGGAEAQLLRLGGIQHEVERRQHVRVAAAVLERHVVGIHAVPGCGADEGRSVRIGLRAIDRQLGPDHAHAEVGVEDACRIAGIAHDEQAEVVFSLTLYELRVSLKNVSVLFGNPRLLPQRIEVGGRIGHAAGHRILHRDGAVGEIVVRQEPDSGLVCGVEYGMVA